MMSGIWLFLLNEYPIKMKMNKTPVGSRCTHHLHFRYQKTEFREE